MTLLIYYCLYEPPLRVTSDSFVVFTILFFQVWDYDVTTLFLCLVYMKNSKFENINLNKQIVRNVF